MIQLLTDNLVVRTIKSLCRYVEGLIISMLYYWNGMLYMYLFIVDLLIHLLVFYTISATYQC